MPSYPGGKAGAGVYQRIINLQPPHDVYVEPFLGWGAVMRRKLPARLNVGIDLDPDVVRRARDVASLKRWLPAVVAPGGEVAQLSLQCLDALAWLRGRDLVSSALVYCDPPYLASTRSQRRRVYRCEMSESQHEELLDVLSRLHCRVQISGYWSELYALRLASWWSTSYDVMTRGGHPAREWLWMNYQPPEELHDYRYLGRGFRERERIKRRRDRWIRRLSRMGPLDRASMLLAMREAWPDGRARR